jgi:hypothetical protein
MGNLSPRSLQHTADVWPASPDALPEEQARWLAENGISWNDDAA